MNFEVIESNKLGGDWPRQYVVVREKLVYLRLVGDGTYYHMITATAGENFGGYRICRQKNRMLETATQLVRKYNLTESPRKDLSNREYIGLFTISHDEGKTGEVFTEEIFDLITEFFFIYDESY